MLCQLNISDKFRSLNFDERRKKISFIIYHYTETDNLDEAIKLLDVNDRNDFINYLDTQKMLNPANMFICKSKEKINSLFNTLFSWLEKCESVFESHELKGYGQTRIYAFLSERFLPYWLKKNTKVLEWPILYYDIRNKIKK